MEEKCSQKRITILLILLLFISSLSCCIQEPDTEPDDNNKGNGLPDHIELQYKVDNITAKVLAWVETLDVDPIKLRTEMGIKGKKKFVELLDVYLSVYETTNNNATKNDIKKTVETLAQVTYNFAYHDLNTINDTQFRQDSTSYLRAWYILNEFGFNMTYYMEEIEKVLPRITNHLPSRGTNQKMAFVFYYNQLGYPIQYTIEGLFNISTIRSHGAIENLTELDIYYITHEIFFLYDENELNLLTYDDIKYLKQVLAYQVNLTISENNVDLLAELIMVMNCLGYYDMYEYELALVYLLNSQNANGSFGDYEDARKYYQDIGSEIDVDIYLYLHTTEVTLRALRGAAFRS